jgi:hypothetical protein
MPSSSIVKSFVASVPFDAMNNLARYRYLREDFEGA